MAFEHQSSATENESESETNEGSSVAEDSNNIENDESNEVSSNNVKNDETYVGNSTIFAGTIVIEIEGNAGRNEAPIVNNILSSYKFQDKKDPILNQYI
ncbi:28378_t:CDS:1, partial [Dentiscutata erythropus]